MSIKFDQLLYHHTFVLKFDSESSSNRIECMKCQEPVLLKIRNFLPKKKTGTNYLFQLRQAQPNLWILTRYLARNMSSGREVFQFLLMNPRDKMTATRPSLSLVSYDVPALYNQRQVCDNFLKKLLDASQIVGIR